MASSPCVSAAARAPRRCSNATRELRGHAGPYRITIHIRPGLRHHENMPGWLTPLSACGAVLAWLTFTAGAAPSLDSRDALDARGQSDVSAKGRAVFHHLHLVS